MAVVFAHEGGYSNVKEDRGGETNLGITAGTLLHARTLYPDLNLPKHVKDLTRAQAQQIYRREYWLATRCDELSYPLALVLFDAAVNHGRSLAIRLLQRSVDVPQDGSFGPKTMEAVKATPIRSLLVEFCAHRMTLYGRLGEFSTFGLGWSRRLFGTFSEALKADV